VELKQIGGGSVQIEDGLLETPFREGLVHQVVTAYMAGGRSGTKAQKNRAAVSGGGRKPWRQKGTGRARAGTIRSPIWRSGGVTFAATNRDFSQKVNRKMYRGALRSIVAELHRQERLLVVKDFALKAPKTKDAVAALNKAKAGDNIGRDRILIVVEEVDDNLVLATRNIPYVEVAASALVDPVSLVGADKIVMSGAALTQLQERLA